VESLHVVIHFLRLFGEMAGGRHNSWAMYSDLFRRGLHAVLPTLVSVFCFYAEQAVGMEVLAGVSRQACYDGTGTVVDGRR